MATILGSKWRSIPVSFLFLLATSYFFLQSDSRYIRPDLARRQDLEDDDEPDQDASASYQNQDQNNNPSTGGYEDTEQDGPYGETPREEEGQADLERFFDDHLGASERDGMDKENLPSDKIEIIVESPNIYSGTKEPEVKSLDFSGSHPSKHSNVLKAPIYSEKSHHSPKVETQIFKSADDKLIVARQITSDSSDQDSLNLPRLDLLPELSPETSKANDDTDGLEANASEVVVTENDDDDKVYVTNLRNRRFNIPSLGGYDPEEDFKNASEDIDSPSERTQQIRPRAQPSEDKYSRQPRGSVRRDISFNDPEADAMFNDASQLDEVTFGQDDPDLEVEMRNQGYDTPGVVGSNQNGMQRQESRRRNHKTRRATDDDESGWVNDGVDDMDIPSQEHQEEVLAKAARKEALAKRAAEDEAREAEAEAEAQARADSQPDDGSEDDSSGDGANQNNESDQRMPNANYLLDDLSGLDEPDYRAA